MSKFCLKLMIAYDLKHQIECLPQQYKDSVVVDHANTDHTMLERISTIIQLLEGNQNDIKQVLE